MAAQKIQHAAPELPQPRPFRGIMADAHLRLDREDFAQLAALRHIQRLAYHRVIAIHIAHLEGQLFRLDRLDQLRERLEILRARLVQMNGDPLVREQLRVLGGQALLRLDGDRVQIVPGHQLVHRAMRRVGINILHALRVWLGHADQLERLGMRHNAPVGRNRVIMPRADLSDSHFPHLSLLQSNCTTGKLFSVARR